MAYPGQFRIWLGDPAIPPPGWMVADGTLLNVAGHEALYGKIGNKFGGDGQNNFRLPDMRSRVPIHANGDVFLMFGAENIALVGAQLPAHNHGIGITSGAAGTSLPGSSVLAVTGSNAYRSTPAPSAGTMAASMVATNLGTTDSNGNPICDPHNNMPPFIALPILICVDGGEDF